jgi:nucleotide-binding universal stress UspA family protein
VFEAKLSVQHVSILNLPSTTEELLAGEAIRKQANKEGLAISFEEIKGDSVPEGLINISDAGKLDLLVLVHKQYDFFEGIFHSSVSKQLAHSTKVPLLVMPYKYSLVQEDVEV